MTIKTEAKLVQMVSRLLDESAQMQKEVIRIKRLLNGNNVPRINTEKEIWVTSAMVQEHTGWNKEQMRRARERGHVMWRKGKIGGRGMEYDLNSIPAIFIIKSKLINDSDFSKPA